MPIIDKFGDLSNDKCYKILIDHVCTFVEKNQVPWTDLHGQNILFIREKIFQQARRSCSRLLRKAVSGSNINLNKGLYLLCIFDAIMNTFAKLNGKQTWINKSMGMSKFHDLLLTFYGEKRLRYIYLVRDPRDVAMSFMKTPVGDCHYYQIVSKWTNLQRCALSIVQQHPDLVHQVHYEDMLKDEASVIEEIYKFIGERRFGGVQRQASVLCIKPLDQCLQNSRRGRQTKIAHKLSYQFQNLVRGDSFKEEQINKWSHPESGLSTDALIMIESIALDVMEKLDYDSKLIGKTHKRVEYDETEVLFFEEQNKLAIQEMNDNLKIENPGDFERRRIQANVLSCPPTLLQNWKKNAKKHQQEIGMAKKSHDETVVFEDEFLHPATGRIRLVAISQKGHYPLDENKKNQDVFKICNFKTLNEQMNVKMFAVYDGHGIDGHLCAEFTAENLPTIFYETMSKHPLITKKSKPSYQDLVEAGENCLQKCHEGAHELLIENQGIDSRRSGTTAISVCLFEEGRKLLISNLGDSSCILGKSNDKGQIVGTYMVKAHDLLSLEEAERVQQAGGIIKTVEEKSESMFTRNSNGVSRIWHDDPMKSPGVAFTRSIGDSIAHEVGVIARPDVVEYLLTENDRYLIICSDGVTQWMDEQSCMKIIHKNKNDMEKAAKELVKEATLRWTKQSDYIDDISAIIMRFGEDRSAKKKKEKVISDDALTRTAIFWTLFTGAVSGYLGGLCGIRGPPLILYFLHPPNSVKFTKKSQRATGACLTATNVFMRTFFYLIESFTTDDSKDADGEIFFVASDWKLYVSISIFSVLGVLIGTKIFEKLHDSRDVMKGILTVFLLLCGISLILTSFS